MTPTSFDTDRITHIFFPYVERKASEVRSKERRFVYYTTAETATRILSNKQIWLRNTTVMNDYSEVLHGFDCLNASCKAASGNIFNARLNACFRGLADEVKDLFEGWSSSIQRDTYITCVSEHLPGEDQRGRLSMWRAYGGQTGVALVLNSTAMLINSNALNVFSSPVAYLNRAAFAVWVKRVAKNMERERDYIQSLGREKVKDIIFHILRFAVLCTKHPGFKEEREWRVIASPAMHPTPHLTFAVEVIRGTPQTVLHLDLKNHPAQGLSGLAIPELLDRIIIGPCQSPQIVRSAFHRLLEEVGMAEPGKKVFVSDIPLRQP